MKILKNAPLIGLILAGGLWLTGCSEAPTSEQLVAQFPNVGENSTREENVNVMCPFVRMLERSGLFDEELANKGDMLISTDTLTQAAGVFGCSEGQCGVVVSIAGIEQSNAGEVDLIRLHDAGFLSHECGLTFELGATQVSDNARQYTLSRLAELSDAEGHLVFDDLMAVKQEICDLQGVEMTFTGEAEVKLLYSYLGGPDRDFIDYSDVEKLFYATMPATKAKGFIGVGLLGQAR